MQPLITKVIIEVGRTLGKAVVAGLGMELARVASLHLRKRLAPKDAKGKKIEDEEPSAETVKAENERLKAEVDRLKEELATARKPA